MTALPDSTPPAHESAGLRAEAWEGLEGLHAQREAWNELVRCAEVDPLGNDFDWVFAHISAFGDPREVFGWTLTDDGGRPIAILNFRCEPRRGLFALTRALITQDGTFDSEYLDVIVRPGFELASMERMLELLSSKRGVDCVVLTGVPDSSPSLAALRRLLEERKLPRRERVFPACAAPLPETFEDFLKARKKRIRSKIRSAMRRAEEAGAELIWSTEPETLAQELESLFELHQQRWLAAGKPGSFAGPERREFYKRLAPDLLGKGQLAFARLEREGQTVACQFGATIDGTYYQIQEGFDPEQADLRVGTALRGLMIAELIQQGVRSYDFMAGIGRHKTDWGADPRPCTTVAFALPRLRARLAYRLREYLDQRNASRD